MVVGGGSKAGVGVGASDKSGAYPADSPQRPEHLAATICHALGIPVTAAEIPASRTAVVTRPRSRANPGGRADGGWNRVAQERLDGFCIGYVGEPFGAAVVMERQPLGAGLPALFDGGRGAQIP